jgi:TRAP-type C4-dicarboxylate transport system substrate-binding protein
VPRIAVPALLIVAAVWIAGSDVPRVRGQQPKQIRIATLAPRNGELGEELKHLNKLLREQSGGGLGLRVYPSGVTGDENKAIQKIRERQMEGAVLTATGLGQIVPEISALDTPGLITSYRQLEAVLAKLRPAWEKKLQARGFVILAWGEGGRYRIFSRKPVAGPADLKELRAWLWPASAALKALWQAVGARGAALGAPAVYGELGSGSLDAVMATSLTARSMQWQTKLDNVTGQTFGVLVGALVMDKKAWADLPAAAREVINSSITASALTDRNAMRRADDEAFQELLEKDYKATAETPQSRRQWEQVFQLVRKQLTGTPFSASLLHEIEQAAVR